MNKEKVDTKIQGKSSVYLREVIIPHYRKKITLLEGEVRFLRESKKNLLERKNKQISAKRWLTYKSNQKRYAVREAKVRRKAVELTSNKVKKSAFEKADLLASIYFLPVYNKISKEAGLTLGDFIYIIYTSNFKFISTADYKEFFGDSYSDISLLRCKKLGYIDVQKIKVNQHYLSLKGRNIVKRVQEEIEKLRDE